MSFLTGTQTELLYAMQASGTAVTAAATTVMTGSTAANPPCVIPAGFFNQSAVFGSGKSLMIKAGGWFTTSSTSMTQTISVGLDTTAGTLGTTVGKTGAFTINTSVTNGAWALEVLITCTAAGTPTASSTTFNCVGDLTWGPANNAAAPNLTAFSTSAAATIMIGAPQTAVTTTSMTTSYFLELFAAWSVTTGAPTITCTNFLVFGLN